MSTSTLTSKGQMTLPKDVRDDLGLKPGDKIDIVKVGKRYVLKPRTVRAVALAGILGKAPRNGDLKVEDMDDAVGQAVAERYDRKIK